MLDWFMRLGHRVRGNLEAWVIISVCGGAVTVAGIVTHGLEWWQQAILLFLFIGMAFWAVYATISRRQVRIDVPPPPPEVDFPDKIRNFCRDLSAYLSNRMTRPDEAEIWNKFGSDTSPMSSPQLFAEKYSETVQLWDDRIAAGYWLSFAEKAAALRHELVLRTKADDELDALLRNLEGESRGQYHIWMQQLIEHFRLLASRLD